MDIRMTCSWRKVTIRVLTPIAHGSFRALAFLTMFVTATSVSAKANPLFPGSADTKTGAVVTLDLAYLKGGDEPRRVSARGRVAFDRQMQEWLRSYNLLCELKWEKGDRSNLVNLNIATSATSGPAVNADITFWWNGAPWSSTGSSHDRYLTLSIDGFFDPHGTPYNSARASLTPWEEFDPVFLASLPEVVVRFQGDIVRGKAVRGAPRCTLELPED